MTKSSPSKPLSANAPIGFLAGFFGGMAAYYLTHSPAGKKLRDQLLAIYDQAKSNPQQYLDQIEAQLPPQQMVDALDSPLVLKQSRYTTSLLKRVKAKLARSTTSISPEETPKAQTKRTARSQKRYFTRSTRS